MPTVSAGFTRGLIGWEKKSYALMMAPLLAAPETSPLWALGTRDFVQYWSAFHLLLEGKDPYASAEMSRLQQEIHFPGPLPVLMWNPPWLLLLLAPILWMDFEGATSAWVALNVVLLAGIPFVVAPKSLLPLSRGRFTFLAALTMLFFPVLDTIKSGQLGVLLAFGVALVLRALSSGAVFTGGMGFAILSVKPHLAVMMGLALLFRARGEG